MAEPTTLQFSRHFCHSHKMVVADLAGISHFRQAKVVKSGEKEVSVLVSGKQEHSRNPQPTLVYISWARLVPYGLSRLQESL